MRTDHDVAAGLAEGAGEVLLRLRNGQPHLKGAALQAAGDCASQTHIATALRAERPNDLVLSEEAPDDQRRITASRVWIIDPLDGTLEFSLRPRSDWAVHVALYADGHFASGAVAVPARGMVYRMDQPVPLPARRPGRMRLAVSRSRPPELVVRLAATLGADVIPMGSAGVKAMAVLDGTVDAYVHAGGQYEWDSAAPVAVALGHGLRPTRLDGTPLRYNRPDPYLPDLMVARPDVAAGLRTAIADVQSGTRVNVTEGSTALPRALPKEHSMGFGSPH